MKQTKFAKSLRAVFGLVVATLCAINVMAFGGTNVSAAAATTYNSWFADKEEVTGYAYSFAVVGDTQIVAENDTQTNKTDLNSIYKWIVDHQEEKNIQFCFGLGDITNAVIAGNNVKEWQAAKTAISQMDGKVSYSLIRGNHDYSSRFNEYFNNETYTRQFEGCGGFYQEGRIDTSWRTLTIGENKYLLIALDYGANDAELAWASDIVEQHLDHKVIVTTHAYLDRNGEPITEGGTVPPKDYLGYGDATTGRTELNNGDDIWNKFVSKHPNMYLVLSGHVDNDDIVKVQRTGVHGNTVTEMLIDPQAMDSLNRNGSTGMVAMLYFSENGSVMDVEYYSTVKEQYWKSANQFQMPMPTEMKGHIANQQVEAEQFIKIAPTHLAFGEYYCSCVCGKAGETTFYGTEKVEGHEWQEVVDARFVYVAPTCSGNGVYYKSCACGEISSSFFITDPLGHDWTGDCDERHCQREECGLSSPINHKWDNGVVTKEATTEEAGVKTYACTKCQDTKTEEIPMLTPVEPDTSTNSSEEKVESSMPTESVENAGGMLNCSSAITGSLGMFSIIVAAALVALQGKGKRKEKEE